MNDKSIFWIISYRWGHFVKLIRIIFTIMDTIPGTCWWQSMFNYIKYIIYKNYNYSYNIILPNVNIILTDSLWYCEQILYAPQHWTYFVNVLMRYLFFVSYVATTSIKCIYLCSCITHTLITKWFTFVALHNANPYTTL